jgi:hypothetical protein
VPDRHAILAGRVGSGASAYRTVTDTKGGNGLTDLLTKWRALPLMWSEALRALVCLVPMMVPASSEPLTTPREITAEPARPLG